MLIKTNLLVFVVLSNIVLLSGCGGGGGGDDTAAITVDQIPPVIVLTGPSTVNHEQGTDYVDQGATATDAADGALTVETTGTVGADAGTYLLKYTAIDSAGNLASATRNVIVADTTAPMISVSGPATMTLAQGVAFTDPGASAMDAVDGPTAVVTTGSVGSSLGTYTITYEATDSSGNRATETRKITVISLADQAPPIITLIGSSTINHAQGTVYSDQGATATDAVDGPVAVVTTGSVGTDVGTYTLTYSATDNAGNTATATRTVVVESVPVPDDSTDLLVFDNGAVDATWDRGISAFDTAAGSDCSNDGGAACPSISWQLVPDSERGDVLQITHSAAGNLAGVFIAANIPINVSAFSGGNVVFDIKIVSGDSNITMKLDCVVPCTSGDQVLGSKGASDWETVEVPFATLVSGGLDLTNVNTGIVIWATNATSTVFQIDNIRFTGFDDSAPPPTSGYKITAYGAGSISDTINPASYRCVVDYGNWIYNAGVVEPAIPACNESTGVPTGTPTPVYPQLSGPAANRPTPTHKWWGSIPFLGEMTIGDPNDAAYITPDPIMARISNRGIRASGIPSGLRTVSADIFMFQIPDPFSEVFDGVAIGNSSFDNMDAYLKDHSDGSVTVEWQSAGQVVMEATFVHGSPYVYVKAYQGELVVRTLRTDGGEKGVFYNQDNSLGIWTNVAGIHTNFLVTGEGDTTFGNTSGSAITVSNAANELTLTYLPQAGGTPGNTLTSFFAAKARNVVTAVNIDYAVDRTTNKVTVSHQYIGRQGVPIDTIVGLHPLHWKHSVQPTSGYQARSARGIIKFSLTDAFEYQLPYVGVLPSLPSIAGTFDQATLEGLVTEFVSQNPDTWNIFPDTYPDTYWSGKSYGKVAELIAIADSIGMTAEATQMLDWLKSELADWFTAETNGSLDTNKYFVYDNEWNTLLGMDESFGAHQQLNDHHFHYGYFVRAAAEICRIDIAWCGPDEYGPMVELLIRDYAGDANDPMFPYLRNFDPANGFSWASGPANFVRGNNNESTSEAANAYGAIVLYGLITGNDALVEKGMYLHASTGAAYWQYWNNIDGYNNVGATEDNFPPGYNRITTSIIWGDGATFSTWFSPAFAHILGIQGLPANALILHVGQYFDYMLDYVTLGLSESSNIKPSGLPDDQWRDLWWNLLAMTDAEAAITDYNTVADYVPEAGETKAHTYHWIHTFRRLGHMITGTGALTSDYPAALAFDNNGLTSYVVYNFSGQPLIVRFSDGHSVNAAPYGFTVTTN